MFDGETNRHVGSVGATCSVQPHLVRHLGHDPETITSVTGKNKGEENTKRPSAA